MNNSVKIFIDLDMHKTNGRMFEEEDHIHILNIQILDFGIIIQHFKATNQP